MAFLTKSAAIQRLRFVPRIPRTITRRPYSSIPPAEQFTAPQAPLATEKSSSPIGAILGVTITLAGSYVGGLFAGEKVPEVKKFYDEYLPFSNEARGIIGLPLSNVKPKDASFGIKIPGIPKAKESKKEESKEEVVEEEKAPSQNAPFVPEHGVKVVITGAPQVSAPAAEVPKEEPKEEAEPAKEVLAIEEEEQKDPSPKGPPMNEAENKGHTAPLLVEDDRADSTEDEKPLSSVSPAEAKVGDLIQEIEQLNKEIEERNQLAVTEILEKSKQNLQLADQTIKGLQSELEQLLKKSDSVLTSTRTQEIQQEIERLRAKLIELSNDKLKVEEHFKQELQALHSRLQQESQAQVESLQDKHRQELQDLASRHDRDLAHQYRTQENLYTLRVKEELQKQEETLEALFKEEIDVAIRKERSERMVVVERLSATAKSLESIARKQSISERENASIRKVLVAVTAFQEAVENKLPFSRELRALKLAAADFPLVQQILESVDESVAEKGIPTPADLTSRFISVKQAVSEAAYVSPTGGLWSFATSWLLSRVSLPQSGLVEGQDPTAILARSEYYLHRGDFENATRELNQLRGWQKKLALDWLVMARQYLEVHQALAIVEAEIAHQLLVL